MKRKRFTDQQIIGVLREHEAGGTAREICRRHGISEQTFYRRKSKYGGMGVSETRRLKDLESENAGELASLIRVEDLRLAVSGQCVAQGFDADYGLQPVLNKGVGFLR